MMCSINLDWLWAFIATNSEISSDPLGLCEITVGTENSFRESITDITPIAEDLRPANGSVSGDRPHCELMLIFPKMVAKASIISAVARV